MKTATENTEIISMPCYMVIEGERKEGVYTGFSHVTDKYHVSFYDGSTKSTKHITDIHFLQNIEKPKIQQYHIGQMVYSYQNKTIKCPVIKAQFRPWENDKTPHSYDTFAYKIALENGGLSKWINENSLSLTPLAD